MSGQLVGEVIAASDSIRAMGVPRRGFLALIAIAEKARTETRQASVPWRHIQAVLYGPMPPTDGEVPSTAKRAVADLRDAGLVTVKRGFNNHNGRSAAPLYTIASLTELVTQVTQSPSAPTGHSGDQLASEPTGHFYKPTGHSDEPTGHSGDPLNGSTNGSTNGGSAREAEPAPPGPFDYDDDPPKGQPTPEPPRRCPEHVNWDTARHGKVPDCPGCRDAREAHQRWQADSIVAREVAEAAVSATKGKIQKAVRDCDACDGFGRLDDLSDCPKHTNLRQFRAS